MGTTQSKSNRSMKLWEKERKNRSPDADRNLHCFVNSRKTQPISLCQALCADIGNMVIFSFFLNYILIILLFLFLSFLYLVSSCRFSLFCAVSKFFDFVCFATCWSYHYTDRYLPLFSSFISGCIWFLSVLSVQVQKFFFIFFLDFGLHYAGYF